MTTNNTLIPSEFLDLLTDKQAFAHLATLNQDQTLQSTPVWIDFDGEYVLVNTAEGRRKDRNMQARPQVALSLVDPDNPYRYLEVRGRVEDRTTEGADEHIDKMARKYLGKDTYPFRQPGEVRVIYRIEPEAYSVSEG